MSDLIDRQAAIKAIENLHDCYNGFSDTYDKACIIGVLEEVPPAQPDGYVKIPDTGIDDLSDGYHTFRQLYYQRMMLFATIVKQNRDKAWKSLRHEDGELCFGGGWFIVGVDTPEGSYTYHYEDSFFSLFDCEELECGKHWDGHTEKDVARLLSLPSAQPERTGKWIFIESMDTRYDTYKCNKCKHEITVDPYRVDDIGFTIDDMHFCPHCGAKMEVDG